MRFFTCLMLLPFAALSQAGNDPDLYIVKLIDSVSGTGIQGAKITLDGKDFLTDALGITSIKRKPTDTKLKFSVSHIGYKPGEVMVNSKNTFSVIKLIPLIRTLDEIKITSKSYIKLNGDKIRKKFHLHRKTCHSSSYVQYIPNPENIKGYVAFVNFKINDTRGGIAEPFRVRLFKKIDNRLKLGAELTSDSLIIYNPSKKPEVKVDVSRLSIPFPQNGLLVVFETLAEHYYDSRKIFDEGQNYARTPGLDMFESGEGRELDYDKNEDRTDPYCMVGPAVDSWDFNSLVWYIYKPGNRFAISVSVAPD